MSEGCMTSMSSRCMTSKRPSATAASITAASKRRSNFSAGHNNAQLQTRKSVYCSMNMDDAIHMFHKCLSSDSKEDSCSLDIVNLVGMLTTNRW